MYNDDIFQNVLHSYDYVPDFMRIMAATRISKTGQEWINWMNYINTGTYNSQWMILDTKMATESIGNDQLISGTFTVFEQAVDTTIQVNGTQYLNDYGFWASYNEPFTEEVSDISGRTSAEGFGQYYETDETVRAVQFRDREKFVNDHSHMAQILRWNEYGNSTVFNNPAVQISARYDLKYDMTFGATDSKFTDLKMAKDLQSWAIVGPTTQNGNLDPFEWTDQNSISHDGVPEKFDFDWYLMDVQSFKNQTLISENFYVLDN